ncbi:MAG: hypothetical protein ACM3MK_06365 [Chitinophagales bacterium]
MSHENHEEHAGSEGSFLARFIVLALCMAAFVWVIVRFIPQPILGE